MFIGWIAFVAGGMSARSAIPTYLCAALGLVLGMVGAVVIGGVGEHAGADLGLLIGVFAIVFAALLAQHLPVINLVVCYFIGMTTFFASGMAPTPGTALTLLAGVLVGVVSGLIAQEITGRIGGLGKRAAAA
jgi:hypothetical protein